MVTTEGKIVKSPTPYSPLIAAQYDEPDSAVRKPSVCACTTLSPEKKIGTIFGAFMTLPPSLEICGAA